MKNLKIIDHPLIQHKLGRLRNKNTQTPEFRLLVKELSVLLAFEATRDLQLIDLHIETPFAQTKVKKISQSPILVAILRSGNGMLDALLDLIPNCSSGHVGIYRDKFINTTVEYYFKLPENAKGRPILLLDPVLATGDTLIAAIDRLKQFQVGNIKVLNLLAFDKGAERLLYFHPDVEIITAGCEKELNSQGYLLPGLGDAGQRLFGTK